MSNGECAASRFDIFWRQETQIDLQTVELCDLCVFLDSTHGGRRIAAINASEDVWLCFQIG